MTEIEKTEAEIKVLQKKLELLKEIETHKSQPKMTLESYGKFDTVSYNAKEYCRFGYNDDSFCWFKKKYTGEGVLMAAITDGETHRLLEGLWFNQVKKGVIDEPEHYDEVEWDEKDNLKPMDEVVDRLVKKYQAQKLWNRLKDELGFTMETCDKIVDLVEDWLPELQSAAGSQNVDTELLVDGFNHCLQKMKEMLR